MSRRNLSPSERREASIAALERSAYDDGDIQSGILLKNIYDEEAKVRAGLAGSVYDQGSKVGRRTGKRR